MAIVRTQDVKKEYVMGDLTVHALKGVDIEIEQGEYLSIMGPSGSGKTTLFNMVGGLDKPSSGKVYIDDVDVAQLDAYELAWLRCRKIGYIFQSFNLIPVMTALENVTLPMVFAGLTSDEARDKGSAQQDRVYFVNRCPPCVTPTPAARTAAFACNITQHHPHQKILPCLDPTPHSYFKTKVLPHQSNPSLDSTNNPISYILLCWCTC